MADPKEGAPGCRCKGDRCLAVDIWSCASNARELLYLFENGVRYIARSDPKTGLAYAHCAKQRIKVSKPA